MLSIATSISIYKSRKISSMIIKIIFSSLIYGVTYAGACVFSLVVVITIEKCTKNSLQFKSMCDKNTYILFYYYALENMSMSFWWMFRSANKEKKKNISKKL